MTLSCSRGESGDSIQATVNMPLVEADILTAGSASRAEVQLDYSNFLRLNEFSAVRLANLGHRTFRLQLERGILTYSELRGGDADVDVETPLAAVRPEKNGRYRVEVVGLDRVIVTVRKGRAEVASAKGTETLKSGQRMIIRKGDQGVEFQVAKADPRDDWDLWNSHRDRQLMKSKAYRYVHTSVYGVEDLDGHGDWVYVPSYGRCWFPSVTVGWAPYRYGRWSWLDYYGWTWVSHDPWGWAPYHYGRWFRHARYGWGWYPGSYYSRHRWRPALVAFFGFDGRGGLGIGLGSRYGYYGWIPLAPGEPYYPWVWTSFSLRPRTEQGRLHRFGQQPDQHLQQLSQRPPSKWHHPGRRPALLPGTDSECARPAGLRGATSQPDAWPHSRRTRSRQSGSTRSEDPPCDPESRLKHSNPLLFDRPSETQRQSSLLRPATPGDGPIRRFHGGKRHPSHSSDQCPLFRQVRGGTFGARFETPTDYGHQVHGRNHQPAQPACSTELGDGSRSEQRQSKPERARKSSASIGCPSERRQPVGLARALATFQPPHRHPRHGPGWGALRKFDSAPG